MTRYLSLSTVCTLLETWFRNHNISPTIQSKKEDKCQLGGTLHTLYFKCVMGNRLYSKYMMHHQDNVKKTKVLGYMGFFSLQKTVDMYYKKGKLPHLEISKYRPKSMDFKN